MAQGLEEYALAGMLVESAFYGLYLSTFFSCIYALLWQSRDDAFSDWRRPLQGVNAKFLAVTLLLFVLGTVNVLLGFVCNFQEHFTEVRSVGSVSEVGAPWVNIVKPLIFQTQATVADAMQIYRCWLVCHKSLRAIALPAVLWVAGIGLTLTLVVIEANLRVGDRVNGSCIGFIWPPFWGSVIVLNVYVTSVMVYQIWKADRNSAACPDTVTHLNYDLALTCAARPQTKLYTVMRIVIDSALIYTLSTITVLIGLLSGHYSIYVTSAPESQMLGIAFNLILIRVSRERHRAATCSVTESTSCPTCSTMRFSTSRTSEDGLDVGAAAQRTSVDRPSSNAALFPFPFPFPMPMPVPTALGDAKPKPETDAEKADIEPEEIFGYAI